MKTPQLRQLSLVHYYLLISLAFPSLLWAGGPCPFSPILSPLAKPLAVNQPEYDIENFVVQENKKAVLFRNSNQQLIEFNLESKLEKVISDDFESPFVQLKDKSEKYLVEKDHPFYYNVEKNYWSNLPEMPSSVSHLFIDHQNLYSYNVKNGVFAKFIWFYSSDLTTGRTHSCSIPHLKMSSFDLAEGHAYPYAYFSTSSKKSDGTYHLMIKKVDVRNCQITPHSNFYALREKPVNVFVFKELDSVLIRLQNTHKQNESNVVWVNKKKTVHFDMKDERVIFLSGKHPIVASWSENKQLKFYHLGHHTVSEVKQHQIRIQISDVKPTDLWLSDNGHELFYTPTNLSQEKRILMELELGPMLPQ